MKYVSYYTLLPGRGNNYFSSGLLPAKGFVALLSLAGAGFSTFAAGLASTGAGLAAAVAEPGAAAGRGFGAGIGGFSRPALSSFTNFSRVKTDCSKSFENSRAPWGQVVTHSIQNVQLPRSYIYLSSTFFLFPVGEVHHPGLESDGAIGTVHLANATAYALVVAVHIFKREDGTEPVGYVKVIAVLGIALCDFLGHKFLSCHLHTFHKADDSFADRGEVFNNITHNSESEISVI